MYILLLKAKKNTEKVRCSIPRSGMSVYNCTNAQHCNLSRDRQAAALRIQLAI